MTEPSVERLTENAYARGGKVTKYLLAGTSTTSDNLHGYLIGNGTPQKVEKMSFGRPPAYDEDFRDHFEVRSKAIDVITRALKARFVFNRNSNCWKQRDILNFTDRLANYHPIPVAYLQVRHSM